MLRKVTLVEFLLTSLYIKNVGYKECPDRAFRRGSHSQGKRPGCRREWQPAGKKMGTKQGLWLGLRMG